MTTFRLLHRGISAICSLGLLLCMSFLLIACAPSDTSQLPYSTGAASPQTSRPSSTPRGKGPASPGATAPSRNDFGKYYLAMGDSLAISYQPNFDYNHGYVEDLSHDLTSKFGYHAVANISCLGETTTTMLNGQCPDPTSLRKYPYQGSQLDAALTYLHAHVGQVALVTLDIGANDVDKDVNLATCQINTSQFLQHLALVDRNLTQIILPKLHAALIVHGQLTGHLLLMNYYNPFQNVCPDTMSGAKLLDQHLVNDIRGFGIMVDVFTPYGGAGVPNSKICIYTWMCSGSPDVHPNNTGYRIIANAFEDVISRMP